MKKLPLGILLGLLTQAAFAEQVVLRCADDDLAQDEALGRNQYVKACFPEVIWVHATKLNGMIKPNTFEDAWSLVQMVFELNGRSRPLVRPKYYSPVFLDNPNADAVIGWMAPKVGPTSEDLSSPESTKAYCARPENNPPVNPVYGTVGFRYSFACR